MPRTVTNPPLVRVIYRVYFDPKRKKYPWVVLDRRTGEVAQDEQGHGCVRPSRLKAEMAADALERRYNSSRKE